MESPPEPQCRAVGPWRGLLITASILSCWIQPTSAQVIVVPNPPYGEVNLSVTLDIQYYLGRAVSYAWYRKAVTGPNEIAVYTVESGDQEPADIREKVLPNGSLLIPDLTLSDTDTYHVVIVNSLCSIVERGRLAVYERTTKPKLTASRTNVMENGTLAFTCGTKQEGVDVLWFFNNKPLILKDRMKLSVNKRTLTILSVKRKDAGSYECENQNPISSSRSDPITLTVNYGPDSITFVPNPEKGQTEVKFNDPLMLVCHVESYPPAQYIWQVNGTVNSNTTTNFYFIKNVIWKDSGKYTCLGKNTVTNLSVSRDITIKVLAERYMGGSNDSSLSGGAIIGLVTGVLPGITLIWTLIYIQYFRKTRRASKHQLSERNHSARKHGEDFRFENIVHFRGSALPAQGPGSSPTFPEDPPESSYKTLDITRVDVYDKIDPWQKPEI